MDMIFLEEYIHLEKLCNDIYGTNHGISKYIEDMEATSYVTQSRISLWENTYKKLKELRWKRNQYVHEGNIEFDNEDTEWLSDFYQKIINGKDPLSIKRALEVEAARNRNLRNGHSTNDKLSEQVQRKETPVGLGLGVALAIVMVIIGILAVILFL